MSSKLNWLLRNTQPGSIVLQSWLTKNGISPQLAARYVKSNWLIKVRSGVYVRYGKEAHWQDAVYSLINQLNMPIHVAGVTSLECQGKAHYLTREKRSIWLGVPSRTLIPTWFKELPKDGLLDWKFLRSSDHNDDFVSTLVKIEVGGVELVMSCQELAAYELVNAIPKLTSFEFVAEIFQGLVNLSPKKIQLILRRSASIKANRLFLFLAHYYDHPWVARLDESEITLGTGKRQIVENGRLDKTYLITVPREFAMSSPSEQDLGMSS